MNPPSVQEFGGKGASLIRLRDAGFPVPPFMVVPGSAFVGLDPGSEEAARTLERRLSSPADALHRTYFHDNLLAVRSSAKAEDSAQHSFAGQFKTLLNVPFSDVYRAMLEVWASAENGRAYALAHGLPAPAGMAVIVQEMVPATAAGVAFSANPVTGVKEVVINAVRGLGDKLVDGRENADAYIVTTDGRVAHRQAAGTALVLSDAQALALAEQVDRAHKLFGGPHDVEFAFAGDELYILQSRPVTTLPRNSTVWDNSNIVESYPGLTGPLTFSFIRKMYDAVYRQFSALLGVSEKKIERHAAAFANMLGLLNGRVYYNLNSWYEALALLPGYQLNAAFMEKMMGVKEKPDIVLPADQSSRLSAWWEVGSAVTGILKNLATARRQARGFVQSFDRVYGQFAARDFSAESLPDLWQAYQAFEDLMVQEWKAPLVNDFFAMIYFGLLQKLCAAAVPEDPGLHNRLLAGSGEVLTTQPMKILPTLVAAIAVRPALLEVALQESTGALYQALQQPEHAEVRKQIDDYIATWGERAIAELKLETITYQQDPLMLLALLQSYLRNGLRTKTDRKGTAGTDERQASESLVRQRLKGKWIKQCLFGHVLRQARYFVAQRENLRYYRTRGFGMVRRMMLAMGQRLTDAGVITAARDIFWLELGEVARLAGAPVPMHLRVDQRKALYQACDAAPLPERIVSYGPPSGIIQTHAESKNAASGNGGTLQGIPCCAGTVRAPVKPVRYSDELQSLDGAILATYATDPGFVVLFASAAGILTERGSLLSHAAIVSREMGIPCIVGIEGLMNRVKSGDLTEMDGSTGAVRIMEP